MEATMIGFAVGVAVVIVAALVTCLIVLLALSIAKAARCREPRNVDGRYDE